MRESTGARSPTINRRKTPSPNRARRLRVRPQCTPTRLRRAQRPRGGARLESLGENRPTLNSRKRHPPRRSRNLPKAISTRGQASHAGGSGAGLTGGPQTAAPQELEPPPPHAARAPHPRARKLNGANVGFITLHIDPRATRRNKAPKGRPQDPARRAAESVAVSHTHRATAAKAPTPPSVLPKEMRGRNLRREQEPAMGRDGGALGAGGDRVKHQRGT